VVKRLGNTALDTVDIGLVSCPNVKVSCLVSDTLSFLKITTINIFVA